MYETPKLLFVHSDQQLMTCASKRLLVMSSDDESFLYFCHLLVVYEVIQTLKLCADGDQADVMGDLCVCLDGMTVDPETFTSAEADHSESTVL